MDFPDASQVVKPVESLRGEIAGINKVIEDIEGKLLELVVQRERMIVMRNCMDAGLKSIFGEDPVDGQLDLPLGGEN